MLLLEDDAYGPLEPHAVPIASFIPERTYFAASLSKCIAPGLRVSFLMTPDHASAKLLAATLRASVQMPTSLMVALVTRWLQDGSADAIIRAIRAEAVARQKLAAGVLGQYTYSAHPNGHHIWMPLPGNWTAGDFASRVRRQGLAIITASSFSIDNAPHHSARLSLGAASSRSELVRALEVVATTLKSSVARTSHVYGRVPDNSPSPGVTTPTAMPN